MWTRRLKSTRRPPESLRALGGVAEQVIDFGRPDQIRIDPDVILPVEPGLGERNLESSRRSG